MPQFAVENLPECIQYFESVVGSNFVKSVLSTGKKSLNANYWYKYIKAYKQWQSEGEWSKAISMKRELLEFMDRVRSIQLLQQDWEEQGARQEFLGRLKHTEKVESLLFELRAAAHFCDMRLDVHWCANLDGTRRPDVEIRLPDNRIVGVECCLRKSATRRVIFDDELIKDLMDAASEKLQSAHDFGFPRLVAVKIPEKTNWQDISIRRRLESAVENWYHCNRMTQVNAIYFLGADSISRYSDKFGRAVISASDQEVFLIRNRSAKYPLPEEVSSRLTVDELAS